MNVLALDTSTRHAAVALLRDDQKLWVAPTDPEQLHGRCLIPSIRELLRAGGLRPRDLKLIAVGVGPGSYTGLRIGLAAAKTLAYATGSHLVQLDSLEAIARNAPASTAQVTVVADAQRAELYVADFTRATPQGPLLRAGATRLEPIDRWVDSLAPNHLVLGPGLCRLEGHLRSGIHTGDPERNVPRGESLLTMAREAYEGGRLENIWLLEPLYLRRSAAEEKAKGGSV